MGSCCSADIDTYVIDINDYRVRYRKWFILSKTNNKYHITFMIDFAPKLKKYCAVNTNRGYIMTKKYELTNVLKTVILSEYLGFDYNTIDSRDINGEKIEIVFYKKIWQELLELINDIERDNQGYKFY